MRLYMLVLYSYQGLKMKHRVKGQIISFLTGQDVAGATALLGLIHHCSELHLQFLYCEIIL